MVKGWMCGEEAGCKCNEIYTVEGSMGNSRDGLPDESHSVDQAMQKLRQVVTTFVPSWPLLVTVISNNRTVTCYLNDETPQQHVCDDAGLGIQTWKRTFQCVNHRLLY